MYETAVKKLGIDPIQCWDYTPYELRLMAENKNYEAKNKTKDEIVLAYYIESLARHKKLPTLKKLLRDVDKPSLSKGDMVLKMMQKQGG